MEIYQLNFYITCRYNEMNLLTRDIAYLDANKHETLNQISYIGILKSRGAAPSHFVRNDI